MENTEIRFLIEIIELVLINDELFIFGNSLKILKFNKHLNATEIQNTNFNYSFKNINEFNSNVLHYYNLQPLNKFFIKFKFK